MAATRMVVPFLKSFKTATGTPSWLSPYCGALVPTSMAFQWLKQFEGMMVQAEDKMPCQGTREVLIWIGPFQNFKMTLKWLKHLHCHYKDAIMSSLALRFWCRKLLCLIEHKDNVFVLKKWLKRSEIPPPPRCKSIPHLFWVVYSFSSSWKSVSFLSVFSLENSKLPFLVTIVNLAKYRVFCLETLLV